MWIDWRTALDIPFAGPVDRKINIRCYGVRATSFDLKCHILWLKMLWWSSHLPILFLHNPEKIGRQDDALQICKPYLLHMITDVILVCNYKGWDLNLCIIWGGLCCIEGPKSQSQASPRVERAHTSVPWSLSILTRPQSRLQYFACTALNYLAFSLKEQKDLSSFKFKAAQQMLYTRKEPCMQIQWKRNSYINFASSSVSPVLSPMKQSRPGPILEICLPATYIQISISKMDLWLYIHQ